MDFLNELPITISPYWPKGLLGVISSKIKTGSKVEAQCFDDQLPAMSAVYRGNSPYMIDFEALHVPSSLRCLTKSQSYQWHTNCSPLYITDHPSERCNDVIELTLSFLTLTLTLTISA